MKKSVSAASAKISVLDERAYRQKVLGCWLGKAVGGTLGGPWEGRTPPKELSGYDPMPTAMMENDDLDLQLVWLARLRETGFPVVPSTFAPAWREGIQAWPDEYGVLHRNLDQGLLPPLSGAYDNGFTAGMGAAIRTELWACLAPGDPELARYFARQDAQCDHADEGVWAAEFLATIESLAFLESDRVRLIDAGLAAIPADSRVARAARFALEAWARTPERAAAFAALDAAHGHQNFTDVAINLAIIVLGWCAGERDFGKGILAAVNCGYDADCTCATLGAILGLIEPKGIGAEWTKPIGDKVALGGYITGIRAPANLEELTTQTMELAVKAQAYYGSKRRFPAVKKTSTGNERYPAKAGRALKDLEVAPSCSVLAEYPLLLTLEYPPQVRVAPGAKGGFRLSATNAGATPLAVILSLFPPDGWALSGKTEARCKLAAGGSCTLAFHATPSEADWRPFTSSLTLRALVNGIPMEHRAGLLMTIPMRLWSLGSFPEEEPKCPADARVLESDSHHLDLAPYAVSGRTLVLQTEMKDYLTRNALRRFVVQSGAQTRAWIGGKAAPVHDGQWRVGALHRAGKTAFDVETSAPTRLTIAVAGDTPGVLFHAVGEARGNCNRWVSRLEYRLPAVPTR